MSRQSRLNVLLGLLLCTSAAAPVASRELQELGLPSERLFDRTAVGNTPHGLNITEFSSFNHVFTSKTNSMIVSFTVGTPPQPMRCLLDSGSSDLWVPSARCKSCENQHFFHADKSSTFAPRLHRTPYGPRPLPVKVSYGSGEIVGYPVQDTVAFGSVTLPNQSFIIVEEAALPPHHDWDGICGFGWKQIASAGTPVYKRIQEQGGRAIFGLIPTANEHSFVSFGSNGFERTCKQGTHVWTEAEPVSPDREKSFWVTTGGVAIRKKTPVKTRFLVDTGTTFLLVPPRLYNGLVESVFPPHVFQDKCGVDRSAGNLVVCDCSVVEAEGMLPLRIELGGREFALDVEQLFKRVKATDGTDLCLLQMQPNPLAPASLDPLSQLAGILGGLPGGLGGILPGGGLVPPPLGGTGPGTPEGMPLPPFPFPMPMPGLGSQGRGGLPFPMGGPEVGQGVPPPSEGGSGPGAAAADGERVEQKKVQHLPDGTVCSDTTVWEGGQVTSQTRRCHRVAHGRLRGTGNASKLEVSEADARPDHDTALGASQGAADETDVAAKATDADGATKGDSSAGEGLEDDESERKLSEDRRLQFGGLDFPMPQYQDPAAELWILGGVFLQHFVTIFDFDSERLGFCEPADAEPSDAIISDFMSPAGAPSAGSLFGAPAPASGHAGVWRAASLASFFILGGLALMQSAAFSRLVASRAGSAVYSPGAEVGPAGASDEDELLTTE